VEVNGQMYGFHLAYFGVECTFDEMSSSFLQSPKESTGVGGALVHGTTGRTGTCRHCVRQDPVSEKTFLNGNPFAVTYAVFQHWTDGINAIH